MKKKAMFVVIGLLLIIRIKRVGAKVYQDKKEAEKEITTNLYKENQEKIVMDVLATYKKLK